jgi:hypothetical protein
MHQTNPCPQVKAHESLSVLALDPANCTVICCTIAWCAVQQQCMLGREGCRCYRVVNDYFDLQLDATNAPGQVLLSGGNVWVSGS